MRLIRPFVLITIICLVLVPGCSTQKSDQPHLGGNKKLGKSLPPLTGGASALDKMIVELADPRSATYPLAAYFNNDENTRLISRARIIIGDKCMRRFGFEPVPGWKPVGSPQRLNWDRYGLWDSTASKDQGYKSPELHDENEFPTRYFLPESSSVYQGSIKEYKGQDVPPGGCQSEEILALDVGVNKNLDLHYISDLDQEALTRATQDDRVVARIAQWRTCMKNQGWDYTDVKAPFAYWQPRRGNDKHNPIVSDDERRSATKDLECKKSTQLLGTWLAADIAYQKALVEREGDKLLDYQITSDKILKNANAIIAKG